MICPAPPFLSSSIDNLMQWFTTSLTQLLIPLITLIVILMFFFAIVKAPLDVLKKASMVTLFLAQTNIAGLADTFTSMLWLLLTLILPLALILLLYKAFISLVKL